jgi:hypothetical protein
MNILNVSAPIAIEDLKKYFTDKTTFYNINYAESKLRGSKLITYLSNLDLPVDIELNVSQDELYELIADYMNSPMLVNIESLEIKVMSILAEAKGLTKDNVHVKFIQDNKDLVDKWISKLDSLTLYNMFIINSEETKKFAESFPLDETTDITGVNFISLLKHTEFYFLYQKIDQSKLKFYKNYFNEYMFKGKNIYSFWANPNNPLFLLTFSIGSGQFKADQYVEAKKQSIQGMQNVTSV